MSFFKTDNKPTPTPNDSSADPFGNLKAAAGGVSAPDDAPDVTDALVRKRRAAAAYHALTGRGRSSTMLTSGAGPAVGSSGLGRTILGGG